MVIPKATALKKQEIKQENKEKKNIYVEYFTSVLKVKGNRSKVIPVKTNIKINSDLILECSKAVRILFVNENIRFGEVVCRNVINSGAEIVSIRNLI